MTECILDQPISSAWPVASDWLGAVEGVCQVRRRTLGRDHLLACSARWRDPEAARAARAGGQPALQQFEITGGTRPDLEPEPISQQAGVPPQPSAPPHPAGDRTSGLYRSTKPPGCHGRTTVGGSRSTRVAHRQTPDPAGDVPPFEHGHVDDPVLLSGPGPAAPPAARALRAAWCRSPVSPDLVIRELLVSPRPTFVHTPGRVVAAPPSLRGVNLGLARCARCAPRAPKRPGRTCGRRTVQLPAADCRTGCVAEPSPPRRGGAAAKVRVIHRWQPN